ncbi:MAG: TonB-dependent receptor [Burkholderiales bacterium]|nr:TonB-dependent receptor [Burkholderiales bacterium]
MIAVAASAAPGALAQEPALRLQEVQVTAPAATFDGTADAASQGEYPGRRFEVRPLLRTGEMIEVIPGVIATQHSGGGKANQYFARGFNLDHGTDFRFTLDGVQINFTTHAHGQGFTDLNFIIPELVERIDYRMGTYAAQDGDFAVAGAADFRLYRKLPADIAQVGAGSDGYYRTLLAGSPQVGPDSRSLLYGIEYYHDDGPWVSPDGFRRINAIVGVADGTRDEGWSGTAMFYTGQWHASDQIPARAVSDGRLCRFCTVDDTTGGRTRRYSVAGNWARTGASTVTRANAYALGYQLDLWSNFTYFLEDPAHGDQFEQRDRRTTYGGQVSHLMLGSLGGREMQNEVGVQVRYDDIDEVGLFKTVRRARLSTVRRDTVRIPSGGLYWENRVPWTSWLHSVAGLRYDRVGAEVRSDNPVNSGRVHDGIWSPKFSMVFGPWKNTELYVNYGQGFHSNDVRGGTISMDPATGEPAARVPLLVKARGSEVGARTKVLDNVESTLSLWQLALGSELVYIGDAGTTEPSYGSRRHGVEWATTWFPMPWLSLTANLAWSHAEFRDNPAGTQIPGAIARSAYLEAAVDGYAGWFGSVNLRYFGRRPLTEDGTVVSSPATLLNGRVGYRISKQVRAWLDVFNLLGREVNDIEYFYISRLIGEPASGVADRHFHPAEPRRFRIAMQLEY